MNDTLTTIIITIIASSGFWTLLSTLITSKGKWRKTIERSIVGVLHNIILSEGQNYLDKGYITFEELRDFNDYLAQPYEDFGGNGGGKDMIKLVRHLEVRQRGD